MSNICEGVWRSHFCQVILFVKLAASYVKMKCPAL